MNLQKLQVFLTLYETLNYTETAERLYISQGNVSKQIMALEKELGCSYLTAAVVISESPRKGKWLKFMPDGF